MLGGHSLKVGPLVATSAVSCSNVHDSDWISLTRRDGERSALGAESRRERVHARQGARQRLEVQLRRDREMCRVSEDFGRRLGERECLSTAFAVILGQDGRVNMQEVVFLGAQSVSEA